MKIIYISKINSHLIIFDLLNSLKKYYRVYPYNSIIVYIKSIKTI